MTKLKWHLIHLPRWFALPAVGSAVTLGGLLTGANAWNMTLAALCGAFLMAYAHAFNTWLDHDWTGLDKGEAGERSKPKLYTSGQQPIAEGVLSSWEVIINGLVWLALAIGCTHAISIRVSPWVWLPFGLIVPITVLYSWGKLHYFCEIPLGLGFGPFAVWLGMSAAGMPSFGDGFLAGLPFLLIFGVVAETVDQWTDWEPNYSKGLRNIGALIGYHTLCITHFVGFLVVMTYLVQGALVMGGILAALSLFSLTALPLVVYCMLFLEWNPKVGLYLGLAAVFSYMIALVCGQGIA